MKYPDIANQRGVTIIAVIATMLILAVMGVVLVTMVTTGSDVSINQLQSEQAFNIANGGQEYILANRTFPNYSLTAATNLGAGSFRVATPAYITGAVAIGNTTINVNDTSSFAAAPGRIVIDSEVMTYTAITGTTFTIAAATTAHVNGNAVYPVTTLTADPGVAGTTLNVASATGFIVPGTFKIDNEYLYCTASTATTFTGCLRGYKASTPAAHGIGSNVFQYVITSTGTVGNAQRAVKATVDGGGIVFDAQSLSSGNTASITWSHTVGAGSNRILVVGVSILNSASQTVTGVTYAGTALTLVGVRSNSTNCRVEIWRMVAPATGPNNITVTFSAAVNAVGGAVSLTGVNQTTPIDAAFVSNIGDSKVPSLIISTVTNNAWVIDTLAVPAAPTVTVGAGQTSRWNTPIVGSIVGAGSTKGPITSVGAVTMSWSWTTGPKQQWAIGAVALKPATAGVSVLDWQERY